MKTRVLFICTHNSARSQMAEGFLRHLYGDRYEAVSAGTEPSRVNPYAVRVMAEAGIDISGHTAKSIDAFDDQDFDLAVTLCDRAQKTCPVIPGARETIHQGFDDPAEAGGGEERALAAFRRARDQIGEWVKSYFGPKTGTGQL